MDKLGGHISDFGEKGQEGSITKDSIISKLDEIKKEFDKNVMIHVLFEANKEEKNELKDLIMTFETKLKLYSEYLVEDEVDYYNFVLDNLKYDFDNLK